MNTSTQVISLDIWNTILQSNPNFKVAQLALLAQWAGVPNDAAWQETLKEVGKEADIFVEKTGIEIGFEGRVQRLSAKANSPKVHSTEQLAQLYAAMEGYFLENLPYFLEKNLLEILAQLRQKDKRLFLLSNTGFIKGLTMRKALKLLGISTFITEAIFSDEVTYAKPHAKMFENLQQQAQVEAQNILHIGDNFHADYQGAAQVGINAICFNPNNVYFGSEIHQIDSLNTLLHLWK